MSNKQQSITKGDMERRMRNALVLVPKDKDYMGIYFDDKGLRLEVKKRTGNSLRRKVRYHNGLPPSCVHELYVAGRFPSVSLHKAFHRDCTRKRLHR